MVDRDDQRAIVRNPQSKAADTSAQWQALKPLFVAKRYRHDSPGADAAKMNVMHCKTLVVHGQTLTTGSFNLNKNAARNAENVVTIADAGPAGQFAAFIDASVAADTSPEGPLS